MIRYIQANLLSLIVLLALLLFFFMFFRGCFSQPVQQSQSIVTVKTDTIYKVLQPAAPVQSQPVIITTAQPIAGQISTIKEIIYRNDTTIIKELLERYYSKNEYKDILKIDSIGTVTVNDTISENKISGRSYTYNLKYPVVTNTVTIKEPYKPVNQWFVGAGVAGNQLELVNAFKAGILVKNKRDNIFEINGTISKGGLGGEIGFYHKLKFK